MNSIIGKKQARILALSTLLVAALFALCSCKVSNRRSLIRYAKENYGDCEFISEEHEGSGKDEKRTVYLRDKETGIEYSVTSEMMSQVLDATVLGHTEKKSSNFVGKYYEYIKEEAQEELTEFTKKYGIKLEGLKGIYFAARVSGEDAEKAAGELTNILEEHDSKGLCPKSHLVYAEEKKIYVGVYYIDKGSWTWKESGNYKMIDYVHEHFDKDAKYIRSMTTPLNSIFSPEEQDKLFPEFADQAEVPSAEAYYFKDKDGKLFLAVDLEDFGGKATGVRLFRDNAYGKEEIKY